MSIQRTSLDTILLGEGFVRCFRSSGRWQHSLSSRHSVVEIRKPSKDKVLSLSKLFLFSQVNRRFIFSNTTKNWLSWKSLFSRIERGKSGEWARRQPNIVGSQRFINKVGDRQRNATRLNEPSRFLVQNSNTTSLCSVWQIPNDSSSDDLNSPTIDEASDQLHQPLRKRFDLNVPNSNMIE